MKNIVKLALAGAMVAEASATKSASELVAEAMSQVEAGSEAHAHLAAAANSLGGAKSGDGSQLVTVPIDEKRALTLKVSPTYSLDVVNSVTLKAFRKIVGYDTFESIRRKERNETKDTSDYYNVTVSMMVKRKPVEAAAAPGAAHANSLAATLDKGFPYDD